ncbi:UPF0481 protein At3g47200-like [Corylus avellana]|uniref:UPF0481 protein At3g47200-like n=1 Tax=Corylus avellana TaxID=13451 RepID=UPI001E23287F|nr:UPF0481 protein At3g47200-like [Corylus avellana]
MDASELVIDIPSDLPPAEWPECCIYRVPKLLRKVNEKAYTPKLVSIGPFHHGNDDLKDMEKHKLRYFKDFFQRTTLKKSQKDLASIIAAKEETIRHCYSEECGLESKDFVKMILLDAIFIIELFLRLTEKRENDYIPSKPWLEHGIYYDLIVLENQLPFFVLEDLHKSAFFDSSSLSHRQGDTPFRELSLLYFSRNGKHKNSDIYGNVNHFTDLLRYFFLPPKLLRDSFLPPKPSHQGPLDHLYSATELDEAGLKFKAIKDDRSLVDIKFPENKFLKCCPCFNLSWLLACLPCLKCFPCLEGMERFLQVPCFEVDDSTEALLRNLMALEQCHYPFHGYICSYVLLLDFLINTEKDVALLVDKKVIVNRLGSNTAVADLINNLCTEIEVTGSYYSDLCTNINVYRDNPWNHVMASMKSVYFPDFWRGTAAVVGLIVLTFTFWDFLRPYLKKKKK